MKPDLVYRSATLDRASSSDITKLLYNHKINSIIDLRGGGESLAQEGNETVHQHFSVHPHDEPVEQTKSARNIFRIDIAKSLRSTLWESVSWWIKLCFLYYRLLGQKLYAQRLLLTNSYVGKEGLFGLNMAFLKSGGKDIKRMMDILANANSYPVIIHCSAGKDRTGLTIALIQLICNVPKDEIISQYSKSAKLLESEHGNIVQRLGKLGLGAEFSGSDAEVMEKTIRYIEKEYGSASGYLESIGVNQSQQAQIKALITVQKSKY
ncbi:hypothetical protein HDV01_005882 [Terramyces sp. JEL0728]|nr:hypothetical protein HDV01_005882 [Terramyces sp. JEL0728]